MEVLCNLKAGEILEEKTTPEEYKLLGMNILTELFCRQKERERERLWDANI